MFNAKVPGNKDQSTHVANLKGLTGFGRCSDRDGREPHSPTLVNLNKCSKCKPKRTSNQNLWTKQFLLAILKWDLLLECL